MVSFVVVVGLAGIAAAAPGPTEEFLANLAKTPAEADKYLADCDLLIMPNGEARKPCKLTLADIAGTDKDVVLKATKVKANNFPKSMLGWTELDLEVRVAKKLVKTLHVWDMTSAEMDAGTHVLVFAQLVTDKNALALAKAGKIATPKLTAGVQAPMVAYKGQDKSDRDQAVESVDQALTGTEDIKATLASDAKDGAIVYGSAPGQKYTGKGGSKTLAAWKMSLNWSGKPMVGGSQMIQWGYTQVAAKATDKDKTAMTYGALFVQISRMTGGGSPAPFPAIYIFTVPQ